MALIIFQTFTFIFLKIKERVLNGFIPVILRTSCGLNCWYISSVEKMIKSNEPPLVFLTLIYGTYK